jgi:hypothetical protein
MHVMVEVNGAGVASGANGGKFRMAPVEAGNVGIKADDAVV